MNEPKELAHLDYKYLRTYEGPLAQAMTESLKKEREGESERLLKKKQMKDAVSFERKKFGGIRMCQRCLRTKVVFVTLNSSSLIDAIIALNATVVYLRWIITALGLQTA